MYRNTNRNTFNINRFKTKHSQSNITYIDIPKDTLMDWNFIPKKITQEERKIIEDPLMTERFMIERN